jgi:hypothetical protein
MTIYMTQSKKIVLSILTLVSLGVTVPALSDDTTAAATTAATGTAATGTGTAAAGASGDYLQEIAQYTNATMTAVNTLPAVLVQAVTYMLSWTAGDTSDQTASLQSTFSNYSTQMQNSASLQGPLLTQLTADYFSNGVTTATLPNANDDSFNTVLGTPFFSPDPRTQNGGPAVNSAYNYLKNVSGISIIHAVPQANWSGTTSDQSKYQNYYNATSAVATYNGYVLSQLLTDAQANLSSSQAALLQQASTSDWFATVASEQIGFVLRQMLMYSSQSFVLQSQLLQIEKEVAMTQAMTNTLIMANGAFTETTLLRNAIAKSASST